MTDFADDEAGVNSKRSKAASRKQLYDSIVRQIMSTMPGRLWMWEILASCHMFENAAILEGDNAVQKTYFLAGERNVGLKLLADVMRLCPREYVLAMSENTKLEKDNARPNSRTDPDSGSSESGGGAAAGS